jgi:hypothetical protein
MFDDVSRRGCRDISAPQKQRARPSVDCVGPHATSRISMREGALPALSGEVGLGATEQVVSPRGFEVGSRLLKGLGGAVVVLQAMRARIPIMPTCTSP